MPAPALGPVAQRVYDEITPVAYDDAAHEYFLAHMVKAWCQSMEFLESYVRDTDTGPGYSTIMDPDLAPVPFLDFLSMMVGSRPVIGESEAQKRARIKGMTGLRRGSPQAIYAAASRLLTGNKTVIFNERPGGNAWQLEVYTLASETPEPKTPTAWGDPTNRNENPSVETDASGWGAWSTSGGGGLALARSTARAKFGSASILLTNDSIPSGQLAGFRNVTGVVPGQKYFFSHWVYTGQSGRFGHLALSWKNSGGGMIEQVYTPSLGPAPSWNVTPPSGVAITQNDWTLIWGIATAPANAASVDVFHGVRGSLTAGEQANVDGFMAVQSDAFLDYFDGSMGDNAWVGTAHLSMSQSPTEFDAPEVLAEILPQKPAGIKLTYKVIQGVTWQTIIAQYPSWEATMDANATWGNVLADNI